MTPERIVWAKPNGTIVVTAPAEKAKAPAESRDAWMARVEAKAHIPMPGAVKIGMADVERNGLLNRPDFKVGDRSCRNAWRVDALTGKLFVDFKAARRIAADRFVTEGNELRTFIRERLRPRAMILRDATAITLLDEANMKIGRVFTAMENDFAKMTGPQDVAAYTPAWPTLEE